MRYLYAIVDADRGMPELVGLAGAPLELVVAGDVAAVVSTLSGDPSPDEATLWAHEHVVEALMLDRSLLPVRFGTLLADDDAVRAALNTGAERFRADLVRLAGCVELSVRVLWIGEDEPEAVSETDPSAPGRAYMAARLAETRIERERRAQAMVIHDRLEPLSRECRVAPAQGKLVLSAAYLLPADAIDGFRAVVAAADGERAQWRVVCTGPWPPYSFVSRG